MKKEEEEVSPKNVLDDFNPDMDILSDLSHEQESMMVFNNIYK